MNKAAASNQPTDTLAALCRLGFHIVPAADKKTLPAGWPTLATGDPEKARAVFAAHPGYPSVSIFTGRFGECEALLVIDIDPTACEKPAGLPTNATPQAVADTVAKNLIRHYGLPMTRMHRTPRGGLHLIFRAPHALTQGTSKLGKGIDTRSAGGQIHFGKGYSLIPGTPGLPALAPAALVQACGERADIATARRDSTASANVNQTQATARAVAYLAGLAPAVEGERNDHGYRVANMLKDFGIQDEAACVALMVEHWQCSPPLDLHEIEHCARSAYRYGRSETGSKAPEVQFSALGDYFADAATWPAHRIRQEIESGTFAIEAGRDPSVAAQAVAAWELFDLVPDVIEMARAVLQKAKTDAATVGGVRYEPHKLVPASDAALSALISAGDTFSRGGQFVRVAQCPPETIEQQHIGRGPVKIEEYDAASLRERLMQLTKFYQWSRKAWEPTLCPEPILQTLLSRGGRGAPSLTGLVSAPTVTPSGRLLAEPGYNRETGLYATFEPADFPPIDPNPSREDAQAALRFLSEAVFDEFCFDEPVDNYVSVAALLTGTVRPVLDAAPGFLISAAEQGTGKTAIAEVIGMILTGTVPPAASWPKEEDERRKTIESALREGRQVILFDNIKEGSTLTSESLAIMLTSAFAEGRLLGASRIVRFSTAALVMLTGNNPVISGDLDTRLLACRLNPRMENPAARRFKRDLRSWIPAHRGEIIRAALTVIRCYQHAGCPATGCKPTRFPRWGTFVQAAIVWAGGLDVAAKFMEAAQEDPEREALRAAFTAWRAAFGDTRMSASEIATRIRTGDFGDGPQRVFVDAMRTLMEDDLRRPMSPQLIGAKLRAMKGKHAGGLVLESAYSGHENAYRWYMTEV